MLQSASRNEGGWRFKVKFHEILALVMNAGEMIP